MTMETRILRLIHELVEVKKYWDVTPGEKESVKYCSARQSAEEPSSIFIPISADLELSLNTIEKWQEIFGTESIVLAIQDSDSSTVFYEISKGLAKASFEKSKTQYPDSYLRNNKKTLVTEALHSQTPSTD